MAERINQTDIMKVYKHILRPMGYNVVPISGEAEIDAKPEWKPELKVREEYNKMSVIQVEQAITELEAQLTSIHKRIAEVQVKTLDFFNGQNPTSLTKELYTVPHQARPAISKNSIIVTSARVEEIRRLLSYLDGLKDQKLRENVLAGLQKIESEITGLEIKKAGANSRVEITIQ